MLTPIHMYSIAISMLNIFLLLQLFREQEMLDDGLTTLMQDDICDT